MNQIFTTDNIAIYGGIVATLAFGLTVLQYLSAIKDKKVQLDISYKKHSDYAKNIKNINIPYDIVTGEGGDNIAELYTITVRNIGNVDAYLNEIFGITKDGIEHKLLVQENNNILIFCKKLPSGIECIKSKSAKNYRIFFNKNSNSFELKKCIVVDGTGKQWKGIYNGTH